MLTGFSIHRDCGNRCKTKKYEIEYVDIDKKVKLYPEKFTTLKQCTAFIKKLHSKESIQIAQILTRGKPNIYRLYRFKN